MAHIKRENKAEPLQDYAVYVIFFNDGGSCYIGKCQADGIRNAYKEHYILRRNHTKDYFAREKDAGTKPRMFLLNNVHTHRKGFQPYQIAWARYLLEHGCHLVEGQQLLQSYTEDMQGLAVTVYEKIKDMSFDAVFAPDKELCPDYGEKHKPSGESDSTAIYVRLTPKQYATVEARANELHMTVTNYIRHQAVFGRIVEVDLGFMTEFIDKLEDVIQNLYRILYVMYMRGDCAPADLKNVQNNIDWIRQLQKDAAKQFKELIEELKRPV